MTGGPEKRSSPAAERDFYLRLLDLGRAEAIEPLLEQSLALIVEVCAATKAYLELFDDELPKGGFWRGNGCSDEDVDTIRASISRGIIARAISEGRTIETASALEDDRFRDLGSVRSHEIQAVLCAPVGNPPIGVIYLQGRTRRGPFSSQDRQHAEIFARELAPLADRLVRRPSGAQVDHTREVRQRFRCAGIIGRSRALAQVLHQAALVAPIEVDVLITGSSGTGKSALAQAIVSNGRRATAPFVALNCAALPESLLESELFGAERGAHSTAVKKTLGKVAAADGGTLFLDEIGELPSGAQAKLLHLLQAREYHPLGATLAVKADVRIITATNANLKAMVEARKFREDLYYRLHVLPIEMPGLSERREDIPELVEYLCAQACQKHGMESMPAGRSALSSCRDATWPGHIRQLANALEAAVIRAHGEQARLIEKRHIFPEAPGRMSDEEQPKTFHEATLAFQRQYVLDTLERTDWNVSEAARQMGLARSHIYNLISELALKREV